MGASFGPAGNSNSYFEQGYKDNSGVAEYVVRMGLDTFEYQCGRGVHIGQAAAERFGAQAAAAGITLSVHAPYFISLSSTEEAKRLGSARYFIESARAAKAMGARRIVLHSGSCSRMSRAEALALAKQSLRYCLDRVDEEGLGSDVTFCPETMGKINQLGSLDEVIELCRVDDRLFPCIDFGHLNARTGGGIKTADDYAAILDRLENELGGERAHSFHSHFSKIEYSAGGEKRHLTFADSLFGPAPEPLLRLVAERRLSPTFICESDGTQAEDAAYMKACYQNYL